MNVPGFRIQLRLPNVGLWYSSCNACAQQVRVVAGGGDLLILEYQKSGAAPTGYHAGMANGARVTQPTPHEPSLLT